MVAYNLERISDDRQFSAVEIYIQEAQGLGDLLDKMEDNDHVN